MSLITRTTEYLRSLGALERGSRYVLAVSGGIDSMVMMHVFSELREKWELDLHAVYVDHGLRPEAEAEGAFLRDLATDWKISSYVVSIDVQEAQQERGGSIQDVARQLRYDVLERMRLDTEAAYIATAHHADDQAETLVARFLKGAGPEGLTGIRPVNGNIIRPLLWASRSEIQNHAEEHGVRWMEDSSNAEPKYQRNIIRSEVMPVLKRAVNPGVQKTLARSAEMFRAFDEYHRSIAERLYSECAEESGADIRLAVQRLMGYFEAEALLVLRKAIELAGCDRAGYDHVQAVYGLLQSEAGAEVQLPGGLSVLRDRDVLLLKRSTDGDDRPAAVRLGDSIEALGLRFTAKPAAREDIMFTRDTKEEFIDCDAAGDEWTLRRWKHGDTFQPIGFHGRVKVSDFLTDMKLSPAAKPQVAVLEAQGEIVWLCGFRLSQHAAITADSARIAKLTIEPLDS